MAKTAKAGTLAVHLTANANDLERTLKGGIQSLKGFALAAAAAFPARRVVLTGGEPSLFIDDAFIAMWHEHGYTVHIETNGTCELPAGIDWVTCSPKEEGRLAIDRMDEVKVVYRGQELDVYEQLQATHFFLQPCSGSNIPETVDCVMRHPRWRLSLQTHKLIDIR